jgi:prepilin peptidase CpaA
MMDGIFIREGVVSTAGGFSIPLSLLVVAVLVVVAAWIDVRRQRIPNALAIGGAAAGCAIQATFPAGGGLAFAVAGIAVGFLLLVPLYLLRTMGAGDVKLLAMAGAYLGAAGVVTAALLAFVAGGVLAIAVALRNRALGRLLGNVRMMLGGSLVRTMAGGGTSVIAPAGSAGSLPYGVAIALGTLAQIVLQQTGNALF